MKSAHSKILVDDASGVRAPYAVPSPLRAGPKWKFESITLREVLFRVALYADSSNRTRRIYVGESAD
jgi:hypothetical protein